MGTYHTFALPLMQTPKGLCVTPDGLGSMFHISGLDPYFSVEHWPISTFTVDTAVLLGHSGSPGKTVVLTGQHDAEKGEVRISSTRHMKYRPPFSVACSRMLLVSLSQDNTRDSQPAARTLNNLAKQINTLLQDVPETTLDHLMMCHSERPCSTTYLTPIGPIHLGPIVGDRAAVVIDHGGCFSAWGLPGYFRPDWVEEKDPPPEDATFVRDIETALENPDYDLFANGEHSPSKVLKYLAKR